MTHRTIRQRVMVANEVFIFQNSAQFRLRRLVRFVNGPVHIHRTIASLPLHIEHFRAWPKVLLGVPVAIEAPFHEQRLRLEDEIHGVDFAVAGVAADALGEVNRVVEVGVVRDVVDFVPNDRRILFPTRPHRLKGFAAAPHCLVTIHARLRGGNSRNGGCFHRRMAIAAIDSELGVVVFVAERDRLFDHFARPGRVIRPVKGGQRNAGARSAQWQSDEQHPHDRVVPFREKLGHFCLRGYTSRIAKCRLRQHRRSTFEEKLHSAIHGRRHEKRIRTQNDTAESQVFTVPAGTDTDGHREQSQHDRDDGDE